MCWQMILKLKARIFFFFPMDGFCHFRGICLDGVRTSPGQDGSESTVFRIQVYFVQQEEVEIHLMVGMKVQDLWKSKKKSFSL